MRLQQARPVRLGENDALEIQARGIAQIGMAGSRIAVDAPMLAAAIGIDRLVERNVRRGVLRNDGAGRVLQDSRRQAGRSRIDFSPAIVKRFAGKDLEPAGSV